MDQKMHMLTHKIDAITGVYDDLHEKMHEIDKTRKNNLMIYGIKPDFLPEIQIQLETKIKEIFKHHLSIGRDIPTTKISRLLTGKIKFGAFSRKFFITILMTEIKIWLVTVSPETSPSQKKGSQSVR